MEEGKSFEITQHQVLEAYKRVKANKGAGGIDGVDFEEFEKNKKNNLYKLWNRMVSGSYFPKAVRGVEIPKKNGKKRLLGIPTIEDRVAQMVVRMSFEPKVEPIFLENSYGYRPNRSAIDAVGVTRERCFRNVWVLEFDIVGLFDNISHELLMKAVEKHTDSKWEKLYIKRFLTAPIQMPDGTMRERSAGTPQGGVISPVLANLFMHYAFDKWVEKMYKNNPWVRYADDGLIHCNSEEEAQKILKALRARMKECGLEVHPEKTKIVYCKSNRNNKSYENETFDFLGYTFRRRFIKSRNGHFFNGFTPAVSKNAGKAFRSKIKDIRFKNRGKTMYEIAEIMNPVIRGWANYFTKFCSSEAKKSLNYVNHTLILMVLSRYRAMKKSKKKAWVFLTRLAQAEPELFYHWKLGSIPAIG
jgi:RNA-directed DNA polymerase